jgi:xanthine dehydrogenase accessory factor
VLPRTHLLILGRSPIAQTLARLAATIGYRVTAVVNDRGTESFADADLMEVRDYSLANANATAKTFIVVSTQGEGDEEALEQALKSEARYVAFVASKTKAEKIFDYLKSRGTTAETLRKVHSPAGLDLNAKSPEEVAVSILAEIVQTRNQPERPAIKASAVAGPALPVLNAGAKDPVCGMSVNVDHARHKSEYEGKAFYFCCAGCKQAFEREPKRYLAASTV